MGKPRTPSIHTSPQDAALAFYQAFESKDVDAMMATWADDEEIVCVHPGSPRLVGYDAVRASWERIFSADGRIRFRLAELVVIETVGLAMQSALEEMHAGEGAAQATAIATNVLMRTPSGWRMVCHHASASPPIAPTEKKGPLH
jgi:ketosteroid isomerase-like protein